jgi:hypothetical protein
MASFVQLLFRVWRLSHPFPFRRSARLRLKTSYYASMRKLELTPKLAEILSSDGLGEF